jgi:hypothetical protein
MIREAAHLARHSGVDIDDDPIADDHRALLLIAQRAVQGTARTEEAARFLRLMGEALDVIRHGDANDMATFITGHDTDTTICRGVA